MKRIILVFLKFPEPGKVKTRLARAIGEAAAAEAYGRLVEAVLGLLGGLEGVRLRVLYDPPGKGEQIREWVWGCGGIAGGRERLEFSPQMEGDLGRRLGRAVEDAFADGFGEVAVVGTDCVEMSEGTFEATWAKLGSSDVVLGPSHDGGYYLVALKEPRMEIFRGIPWSSEETLEATVAAAQRAGLQVELLEPLRDVDTVDDWREVESRMKDGS